MRVLHITNWFPNIDERFEAPFILEHIKSLGEKVDVNTIVHIQIAHSDIHWFKFQYYDLSVIDTSFDGFSMRLLSKISNSFLIELMTFFMLRFVFFKMKINHDYDRVVFHVAYPLCVYVQKIIEYLKIPFCIVEHWSAYHFNFGLPLDTNKLDRVKGIFDKNVEVVTVSNALSDDIRRFSGVDNSSFKILPNAVNEDVFFYRMQCINNDRFEFFMVNNWRPVKNPWNVLMSFERVVKVYPRACLRIGGYGPLLDDMKQFVECHGLQNNIFFLGKLTKPEIAENMRRSNVFINPSSYETFSVVTAEALMCGLPVIVNKIPAIQEYVNIDNGVIIPSDTVDAWSFAIRNIIEQSDSYDREKIARRAYDKFSSKKIGESFYKIISEL